jgi:membrane protein DedA with SNARE-associated domain
MEKAAQLAPFVRIGLYLLTGWLASGWLDPATVDLIRDDPALLSLISGAIAAAWYSIAKWRGWKT